MKPPSPFVPGAKKACAAAKRGGEDTAVVELFLPFEHHPCKRPAEYRGERKHLSIDGLPSLAIRKKKKRGKEKGKKRNPPCPFCFRRPWPLPT